MQCGIRMTGADDGGAEGLRGTEFDAGDVRCNLHDDVADDRDGGCGGS